MWNSCQHSVQNFCVRVCFRLLSKEILFMAASCDDTIQLSKEMSCILLLVATLCLFASKHRLFRFFSLSSLYG